MGALHAERLARQQQAQAQAAVAAATASAAVAAATASAAAQAKKGGGGDGEEDDDDMAAIEAAIAANARMTELANPPSEATKGRLYGWDRMNLAQRKELQAKLGSRLAESQDKRRAKGGKEDEKKGGGGSGRR